MKKTPLKKKSKTCRICIEDKPTTEFCKDKRSSDSLSSRCRKCNYFGVKNWRKNNPEKHKKNLKKYKEAHPTETMLQARKDGNKNYYRNGQKSRIKYRYGISFEDFEEMKERQNNLCAICKTKTYEKELNIDHCHATGKIRGLLCTKCNTGIGLFCDDINLLKNVITYLNENQDTETT